MKKIFIHGLESSSRGSKGSYFRDRFSDILVPDFTGDLDTRMAELFTILADANKVILVGSSFGGLMATIFSLQKEQCVQKMILLAPALNFPGFKQYEALSTSVPTIVFQGKKDDVTPLRLVKPAAERVFQDLEFNETDDDHLLKNTFLNINWVKLLDEPDFQ